MALQKRRLGRTRIHHRRSSWMRRTKKAFTAACPSCGEPRLPHRVCMSCGQYNSRAVFEVASSEE
jgi:large subunit ribosomal protein L32